MIGRMDLHATTAALKTAAWDLGFDHCRVLPIELAPHADFFDGWLAAGNHAAMGYMARHADKRRDPALLADAKSGPFRSLIVLAVNYHSGDLPPHLRDDPSRGLIASYAWRDDYHEIMRPQLYELDRLLAQRSGRSRRGKALVDTGPVLERDWAHRAGIGFTGKNCCTIHPAEGSWLFLATLLVPEVFVYDTPMPTASPLAPQAVLDGLPGHTDVGTWTIPLVAGGRAAGTCGACSRCLDACPTDAFAGPFHLDARRCISYWTIETQAPIPRELRPRFGNRIFGCDICQEVCPWNRRLDTRTPRLPGLAGYADRIAPPLAEGFRDESPYWRDEAAFAAHFARSPVLRATRAGMARNVCVALGNWPAADAVAPLLTALTDPAAAVRGHAAWGLGQALRRGLHVESIRAALTEAAANEPDAWVAEEIALAL